VSREQSDPEKRIWLATAVVSVGRRSRCVELEPGDLPDAVVSWNWKVHDLLIMQIMNLFLFIFLGKNKYEMISMMHDQKKESFK
jgi:hypothetical protein